MAMRMFVVDDDDDTVTMISLMLRRRGFDVEGWTDPDAALRAAVSDPPAAILCDGEMGAMRGHEFLARLRSWPTAASKTPVILVSGAVGSVADRRDEFDAHLTKPFRRERLYEAIDSALAHGGAPR